MEKQTIEKKHNKIFIQTIILSLIGLFICFGVLCSTSWAWFKDSTQNDDNIIASGSLVLAIQINDASTNNQVFLEDLNGIKECNLNQGEYTITFAVSPNSTATKGYCIITIDSDVFVTELIEKPEEISVKFKFQSDDNIIKFETVWGTPANSNLFNSGEKTVE